MCPLTKIGNGIALPKLPVAINDYLLRWSVQTYPYSVIIIEFIGTHITYLIILFVFFFMKFITFIIVFAFKKSVKRKKFELWRDEVFTDYFFGNQKLIYTKYQNVLTNKSRFNLNTKRKQ